MSECGYKKHHSEIREGDGYPYLPGMLSGRKQKESTKERERKRMKERKIY